VIKCLHRLRREGNTKVLLREVANEFPLDLAAQNRAIDSRRNGSLNRVVREYFGDKGEKEPVLAFRHEEEQDNCKALRAAYGALATSRDCDRSVGSKMLHYARLLGHFVKENLTDRELQGIATSLGYADYFTTKPVPFPTAPSKEKVHQVRTTEDDFETIKQLQELWKLPNQQSVVTRLIESQEKLAELGKQLLEAKNKINQLEKETIEMSQVQAQPQQITVIPSELEAMIERMVSEKIEQALSNLPVTQPASQHRESKPTTQQPVKQLEVIDWVGMSNADL